MRLVFIASSIALLTACGSNFVVQQDTDVTIGELLYFQDQDGDGWGNPGEPQSLPEGGNTDTKFTARNGRDCDDSNTGVTARVGSLCPQDLVSADTSAAGVVYGQLEFVAVLPDADAVWAEYGHDACAAEGWGGSLAVFNGSDELDKVKALITGDTWAGWVGLKPAETCGDPETDECWAWDTATPSASFPPSAIGFCSPADRDPGADKFFGLDEPRLALVRRPSGTPLWCLGTPDEADSDIYFDRYAQFACVRATPDPVDWDVYPVDDAQ